MARKFWHYSGDKSIRHGGMYYNLDNWKWGYVEAWRVVPCSDAGGPDNVFWIEELTINIRKGPELASLLASFGDAKDSTGYTPEQWRHYLVQAHEAYGAYDQESSETLQVGPDEAGADYSEFAPDKKVREQSLRNCVRKLFKES